MALVFSVRVRDIIEIGSTWIKVCSVNDDGTVTIRTSDGRGEGLSCCDLRLVFPGVAIGLAPARSRNWPRLRFQAPPTIQIRRRPARSR